MENNTHSGWGLGRLKPAPRLIVVFTISVLFILIHNIISAIILLIVGIYLFVANEQRPWKLAIAAPISGGMLTIYNILFSPKAFGGWEWFIFRINEVGINWGLITGMRLCGVMLISFAWLFSTPIPEMYEGLAWIKPFRTWVLGILRGIQILKREFVALTQSLLIRGLKWNTPWANIKNLVPLATAVIPRIVENSQKSAFASQSHSIKAAVGKGDIKIEHLHVRYSPVLPDVLQDINLEIEPGEFIYIAGKSAAGKTSLLRSMGGVISYIMGEFKGKVFVSGMLTSEAKLTNICGSALYIAPDPFASIYGLTVGQEIMFMAQDDKTAKAALKVMGIENLWDRETTNLSGGQQVRLVLAGAIASDARILLLDSPMQELDPGGRQAFLDALETLRSQRRCTIVLADFFWQQLQPYVDRVIVLEDGQVSATLNPQDFFVDQWLERCHLINNMPTFTSESTGDVVAKMEDVHVWFGENHVLKGISLEFHEGEFVAIMGPNGSGKTTAMLTLAGAIKPKQGTIETQRNVAYTFQHAALQIASMTAKEELIFGPKMLGWSQDKIDHHLQAGLEWTGLDPKDCPLDLHPADLRMLTIAAVNTDPCAFILDEPTIGLDSAQNLRIFQFINKLCDHGKAVIVITHDEQIASQAQRIITIKDGVIADEERAEFNP